MSTRTEPRRPPLARWLATTNDVTRIFLAAGRVPNLINMAGGLPEPATFPVTEIAAVVDDVVRRHAQEALAYAPAEGLPELRDALAERFGSQALTLTRANVLVTSGGMQGLDLIGKVLLEQGALIAGQFPTYLGALDAWRPRSPTFRNMVLEDTAFDAVAALEGAQFAYTVPNFSNPTGKLVRVETRRALVDAAHRTRPRLLEVSAQRRPGEP